MMDEPAQEHESTHDYRGETVVVQDFGRGMIVDQTDACVGILIDGPDRGLLWVPIAELKPWDDDGD